MNKKQKQFETIANYFFLVELAGILAIVLFISLGVIK